MRNKIIRICFGIGIFLFIEMVATVGLYLVWITAPQENILWLNNIYEGSLKYLILTVFYSSVTLTGLYGSLVYIIDTPLTEKEKKKELKRLNDKYGWEEDITS